MGGIVTDARGRLLLVKRGREPALGCWSVPGGRKEPNESDDAATAREVLEETGVHVTVGELVGTVEREAPGGATYVIRDYRCTTEPGATEALRAGDDADEAGWFTPGEVRMLRTSPGLVDALEDWGVL